MNLNEYAAYIGGLINEEMFLYNRADFINAYIELAKKELQNRGATPNEQQAFWNAVARKVRNFLNEYSYKSQSAAALGQMVDATVAVLEQLAARATQ
jgi:hypothetical protein